MSTCDQKIAAQNGQSVAFANNAALALSRQVAERQKALAQELRTPVIVETTLDHANKKERPGEANYRKDVSPVEREEEEKTNGDGGNLADGHRIDVLI